MNDPGSSAPPPGGRLARLRALWRPVGADPATARARERERRIVASTGMAMAAKLVSVGTALITVPLTLHYLGPERYGMWMIMSSLVAMLAFADLGIGNGVLNTVAAAYGRDDMPAIREAVSSGLGALTAMALTILAGFAIVYPHVAWHELFNVRSPLARAESGPALAVFIVCFALAIPTGIVQRVQMGLQRSFVASMWLCGGSVLSLAGVLLAIHQEAGLPWLVLAFVGGPLVANALNSIVFFGWRRRDLAPHPRAINRTAAREVVQTGLLFLLLQIAAAVTYNSSNILIAQLLGASQVATYAVPERLFGVITMIVSMALSPLWPAYREAIVRGDVAWTRQMLRRSLKVAVGCAAALSVPLTIAAPWIIGWWVQDAVDPPVPLLVGMGLWKIVEAAGLSLAMFLNGAHIVKPQVIISSITAIVSITLSMILLLKVGVAGAIWATMIAFVSCTLLPYTMLVPRLVRSLRDGAP